MAFSAKHDLLKALAGMVVPWIVRLWTRTLRVVVHGDPDQLEGSVIGFWHADLFSVVGYLSNVMKFSDKRCLVSASADGQLLGTVLKGLGFQIVAGSSSTGGFEAAMHLIREPSGAILITPDGPRGPSRLAKPGIAAIAAHSKKPIVLISIAYSSAWKLASWDQGHLPKPFSKCTIRIMPIVCSADHTRTTQRIEEILNDRQTGSVLEKHVA